MSIVVSLCDLTGIFVRPWAEAGFECYCVDIEHSIRRDREERVGSGVIRYVWGDVRNWTPPAGRQVAFGACWSPCTHVSGSGARDFLKKGGYMLRDALEMFEAGRQVPEKYLWTEHAERNAIYNAARCGTALKGCTAYLPWFPCMDCARAIVQAGIAELVCLKPDTADPKWGGDFTRAIELFGEAGVTVRYAAV